MSKSALEGRFGRCFAKGDDMACVEPGPIFATVRRLRLVVQMGWRHWFPTAAEQSARAERMSARVELGEQQRRAAAAFRWTLLRQRSDPLAKDLADGAR
jgi:hypothetical protein